MSNFKVGAKVVNVADIYYGCAEDYSEEDLNTMLADGFVVDSVDDVMLPMGTVMTYAGMENDWDSFTIGNNDYEIVDDVSAEVLMPLRGV